MIAFDIPVSFLIRINPGLTWQEVEYGFRNRLMSIEKVIEFATQIVATQSEPGDDEVTIAIAAADDPITDALRSLAERTKAESEKDLQKRWARILVAWSFEHRNDFDDLLAVIDDIYSAYDYPEELAPFIRYMPSDLPDLGSKEENEKRMLRMLGTYVAGYLQPQNQE